MNHPSQNQFPLPSMSTAVTTTPTSTTKSLSNSATMGQAVNSRTKATTTTTSTTTTTTTTTAPLTPRPLPKKCLDFDMNCYVWVATEPAKCELDDYVIKHCKLSCQICGNLTAVELEERYDLRKVPPSLQKIAFLIGRWKSDFGGRADFPTIPKFIYGEELDISISTLTEMTAPVLNYTAFAWDNSDLDGTTELHSENGFIGGAKDSSQVALNTVMSNGFVTVEEGEEKDYSITFRLQRIGRISLSKETPVRKMIREWVLLNVTHLESRLIMGTATHRMMQHTHIIYKKIYP